MKKRSSPYNISDVMQKHNITEEEAIERINKYKLQTSQSISGFIFRYGDELGHIKFEEFKNYFIDYVNKVAGQAIEYETFDSILEKKLNNTSANIQAILFVWSD